MLCDVRVYSAFCFAVCVALIGVSALPRAKAQRAAPPAEQRIRPKLKIHVVGEAEVLKDRIRLTSATRQTTGAAWFDPKERVASGFDVVFEFQITERGGLGPGADGFAFVLQNQGFNAIGGRGSAGGFAIGDPFYYSSEAGIPRSIAVFFDTYRNPEDPSDNYIAVCTNGPIGKMRWPPNRLGIGRKLRIRLKDGRVHTARIRYRPPIISVSLDEGEPVVRVPVDLSTVVDPRGFAYVGFTASTGNGFENHDILTWDFTSADVSSDISVVQSEIRFLPTNCLAGRNLCTPADAIVEEKGPGNYHVILPAHLEWGASIPNEKGRSSVISNVLGNVCLAGAGADEFECGGPDGIQSQNVNAAGRAGLLAPDSKSGLLISKTENGRTWFSVNGRKGRDFEHNQGFFEFDVRLN